MLKYAVTTEAPTRPKRLRFGLLSPEEIRRMAVCEVTETTLYYRGLPASGGLLDPLMGSVDRRHLCATCMRDAKTCEGHSGYISLAFPMYHVGYVDMIIKILRCICFGCAKICISEEERAVVELQPRMSRLSVLNTMVKCRKCCPFCGMVRPTYSRANFGIQLEWPRDVMWEDKEEEEFCTRRFTSRDALSLLKNIGENDVKTLGFDGKESHPSNMLLLNVVVPPPCSRPAIYSSEGSRSRGQNDLTIRLLEILKRNADLRGAMEETHWSHVDITDTIMERLNRLQYEIFIFMNNSTRIQKPVGMGRTTGGLNSKSISERLKGKDERVRGNLMGKRVDFSARAVITPDAYFDCDSVGVPYCIAKNLTIPETVNVGNMKNLLERVRRGSKTVDGAMHVLKREGYAINLETCQAREDIVLNVGDVVERFLQDGDVVIFNRQPSLHMHGMQAHRVKLMPGNTLRLSLMVAAPYNADFDGDEMNIHVPQSKAATAECAALMAVTQNCIGAQANKPVMGIVQDALLGLYLLTQKETVMTHPRACRLIGATKYCKRHVPPAAIVSVRNGREVHLFTGKQLFSCLLPEGVHMESRCADDADPESSVCIHSSLLLTGVMSKVQLGTSAGGLTDTLARMFGNVVVMRFMGDCQRMVHSFLMHRGFNVGIDDVMLSTSGHERVHQRLHKAAKLCGEIQREADVNTSSEVRMLAERGIITLLSKMLRQTAGIVEEEMAQTNTIGRMVKSGSKGSFINLSQICACLGQQSLEGSRIIAEKGARTLPFYQKNENSLGSRGMVFNSFALGLTPTELFFHAIGGREGLVDTAVKTAQTGYLQRRMNKSMEDHTVDIHGKVVNSVGEIISFSWGADGFHPARLERVRLDIIGTAPSNLDGSFTDKERSVVEAALDAVASTRTSPTCNELDKRCLLPFNPRRIKRVLAAKAASASAAQACPLDEEEAWEKMQSLLSASTSRVLALAILDTIRYDNVKHLASDEYDGLIDTLRYCILHAASVMHESVGCIAAQSVGEPATQMTLNTFHTAGTAAKNVTLGIPRLKELLDASKASKTPLTTIRFKGAFSASKQFASYMADTLPLTRLGDVVATQSILYDPDDTLVEGDLWMIQTEKFLFPPTLSRRSDFVIRFECDQSIMKRRRLTPPMLSRLLKTRLGTRAMVCASETNFVDWVVRIRFAHIPDMIEFGSMTRKHEQILCRRVMHMLLDTVVVSGHAKIKSADAAQATYIQTTDAGLTVRDEYVVHAHGNMFDACASSDCMDWTRCVTNDVWEVYHKLGIEACAHILFDQIRAVVSFDGTYVDNRHLMIIVDTICRNGTMNPLNRHGINKTEASVLRRCSFEETCDVLCNAATYAEQENARGVSSSIMMGQLAAFGTGNVKLLFADSAQSNMQLRNQTTRVLRSTVRSFLPEQRKEAVEYVVDDVRPAGSRYMSFLDEEDTHRKRRRFQLASPSR